MAPRLIVLGRRQRGRHGVCWRSEDPRGRGRDGWDGMTATESERQTRARRVDPRVRRAGWARIVPFVPGLDVASLAATAVAEYPTADGPADYAFCDGGRVVGVA